MVAKLTDVLVDMGVLNLSDVKKVEGLRVKSGGKIEDILVSQGICADDDIVRGNAKLFKVSTLSDWLETKCIDRVHSIDETFGVSQEWWLEQQAFPLGLLDGVIWVALSDISNDFVVKAIRLKTERSVRPVLVTGHDLRQLLSLFDADEDFLLGNEESLIDLASGAPIVKLVNDTIQRALDARASDIHFESYRGVFRIRFRVDGVLHEVDRPSIAMQPAILSRIKLMANLDISEKRLPQDGRIRLKVSGKEIDIRVATSPGVAGESVVLRLLTKQEGASSVDDLGLISDHKKIVDELLSQKSGIILVTGPTGSGKTTSLYTFLRQIAQEQLKVITVEDPVEYQMNGVTQIQVQSDIGLNFASVLRSVLRQDPDVVLIGEIRDKETAEIAVQAALTGHLVLSTLHTNDAAGSFIRLMDMGIENYLLASSIKGVIAQRLIRKSCPYCSKSDKEGAAHAHSLGFSFSRWQGLDIGDSEEFYEVEGCDKCFGTGYVGRMPIFEMFKVSDDIKHIVAAVPNDLPSHLQGSGMRSLRDDGFIRAASGKSTVAEVLRVTG